MKADALYFIISISCSKDSTNKETNTKVLSAKVDGNLINFRGVILDYDYNSTYPVLGLDCPNKKISLSFPKDLELAIVIFCNDKLILLPLNYIYIYHFYLE